MLGGFLGLGLDVEVTGKADGTSVIYGKTHEASHVVLFKSHIGVEKSLVAFSAAPEYVAFTAELDGDFDCFLDLCCRKSKYVSIGRSARTVHITLVAEAVCRTPEKLLSGLVHQLLEKIRDLVKSCIGFREGSCFGSDVSVVEAVVVDAELFHELECGVCLILCELHGIGCAVGLVSSAYAEHIRAFCAHGVPVSHTKAEMFAHGLACDHLVGVVKFKGKRVLRQRAFIFDFANVCKIFHFHILLCKRYDDPMGSLILRYLFYHIKNALSNTFGISLKNFTNPPLLTFPPISDIMQITNILSERNHRHDRNHLEK